MPPTTTEMTAVVVPSDAEVTATDRDADAVLDALDEVEARYREARAAWEEDRQDAQRARAEAASAREQVQRLRGQVEAERQKAERQREKAAQLAAALKDIHRTLFHGNVFDAILRACLSLTGATRGLYLTAWDDGRVRVRAAVDVDGYPRKAPSAFVRALCERVTSDGESDVFHSPAEFAGLPAPDGPAEAFSDCLVAPAVILEKFNGVVILADKPNGFDDADREHVLSVGDGAGVAVRNRHLQHELMRAYFSVVGVLADAIDAKDPYTKGHCELVARLARRTAAVLAADDLKLQSVCCYGGLLHDVGKIGVSDGVLNKPGKLTAEEWLLMQSHVRIGRDLLSKVPALDGVTDVVLHHHERWDGGGYPDGLRADQTSLAARIVCVVDAYAAMTSKRCYQESRTPAEARAELERCRGTHFDPRVVDAFLRVLDEPEEHPEESPDGTAPMPGLTAVDDMQHVIRPDWASAGVTAK